MNKFLKATGTAAMGLCALFAATSANAMDRGTCLPFNQMVSALQAEGQYDVIQADQRTPKGITGLAIYTTNADKSRGYEVGGERPTPTTLPTTLCISRVMRDVKLNNAWARIIPSNFYLPSTLAGEALSRAANDSGMGGGFGDHNTGLNAASQTNTYPAYQANNMKADGSAGATITVGVNLNTRKASTDIARPDGLSTLSLLLENFAYTPDGVRELRAQLQPPQMAALTPPAR